MSRGRRRPDDGDSQRARGSPGRRRSHGGQLRFGRRELLDLGVAWLAMSVAFAILLDRGNRMLFDPGFAGVLLSMSFVTVGTAFLLHELAHKVVAVRFGQLAVFRADYGMLALAVASAVAGFIFAAPGAVHHRGRITQRQNGLVALAGPATNLALAAAFAPLLLLDGLAFTVGGFGVLVNAFLAAFNMLPYGPLDGRTVYDWSAAAFAAAFGVSAALTAAVLLTIGLPLPA